MKAFKRGLLLVAFSAAAVAAPETDPILSVVPEILPVGEAAMRLPDLRARIALSAPPLVRTSNGLVVSAQDTTIERLIEQARGSTDPVVLELLVYRCWGGGTALPAACDRAGLIDRWIVADTQNQIAWLVRAAAEFAAGDEAKARATFVRAAVASTWTEHQDDLARSLVRALPDGLSATTRYDGLAEVAGTAFKTYPFVATGAVLRFCKVDALRDACSRILDAMARDASSTAGLRMAHRLSAATHQPDVVTQAREVAAGATSYALRRRGKENERVRDAGDADAMRAVDAWLERHLERGERRSARDVLLALGLSDEEAARRARAEEPPR